jgi:exonuclease III
MITIQSWRTEDAVINRYDVDILAIQEIRGTGMEQLKTIHAIFCSCEQKNTFGVAFMVNQHQISSGMCTVLLEQQDPSSIIA